MLKTRRHVYLITQRVSCIRAVPFRSIKKRLRIGVFSDYGRVGTRGGGI